MLEQFPSLDDGPPKRSWAPVRPACGGSGDWRIAVPRALKFSVQTEDGVTHRFLMTRLGMAWLAMTMVTALTPWLELPMRWWYRRQERISSQSPKSSGMPSRAGSPQEGQAV